jgi:hypothetical protein
VERRPRRDKRDLIDDMKRECLEENNLDGDKNSTKWSVHVLVQE